uniref:Glycosyl transferase family 25 domain-containing protein n=1 Tax=viral metagenome TaxID=1070528 RepID=A0A6C0I7N1_9ZZZZ
MDKYIISLKKNHIQCKKTIDTLNKSGVNNVNIFEAINGNDLIMTLDDIGYKHPYVNVSMATQYNMYNGRTKFRDIPSRGAIGCYLSHVMLWNKLIDNDKEYMLILEDDAIPLDNNLDNKINNLINERNDFDILLLGYRLKDRDIELISKNISKCKYFVLTHSYIISKKGALKLLKHAFPIEMQVDNYMSFYSLFDQDFKIYYSNHMLFKQSNHISSIQQFCITCMISLLKDKHYMRYITPIFIFYLIILILFLYCILKRKQIVKYSKKLVLC